MASRAGFIFPVRHVSSSKSSKGSFELQVSVQGTGKERVDFPSPAFVICAKGNQKVHQRVTNTALQQSNCPRV